MQKGIGGWRVGEGSTVSIKETNRAPRWRPANASGSVLWWEAGLEQTELNGLAHLGHQIDFGEFLQLL
ncbi:hypothetical protein GCM10027180_33410 [Microbulbifer echini]